MGILVANLPAFALPEAAYYAPLAWGGTAPADIVAWFATFVLVEGKMRGVFALLFGASMLLVVERAEAEGLGGAAVHFRRMGVLFAIGCLHLYALWHGDILAHYALCGMLAFAFVRLPTRWLLAATLMFAAWDAMQRFGLWSAVLDAQAHPTATGRAFLDRIVRAFGTPPPTDLAREVGADRGSYGQVLAQRWREAASPIQLLVFLGPETLATMLLGMAGLKSGFLTGSWSHARYRLCAILGLGLSLPVYAVIGASTITSGFALAPVVFGAMAAPAVLRWPAIVGYAALGMLLIRPGGTLTMRIAALGRCALSNYLGTTLVMTTIFYGYGLGQFGHLSRAELLLLVPPSVLTMLGWSAPWLRRYRHGPAEWLWRSLARGHAEPIRRRDEPLLRPTCK